MEHSAPNAPDAGANASFKGRREQPLTIRVVHWCNVVFLTLMAGSGLEIFAAYPALGPRGAQYSWYPFQNVAPPEWMRIGGWLAGGRPCPFATGWVCRINGLAYVTSFFANRDLRRPLLMPARDARHPPPR